MDKLEASISQLQNNVQLLARNAVNKKTSSPEGKNTVKYLLITVHVLAFVLSVRLEDPVYVCDGNTLDISCNSSTLIFIETAEYGQYIDNCATCCEPQQADCSQNMAQTNLQQWQALNVCATAHASVLFNCDFKAFFNFVIYFCFRKSAMECKPAATTFSHKI